MISRERYLQYYFLYLWRLGKWFITLCIAFWTLMLLLSLFYLAYPNPTVHYGWSAAVIASGLIVVLLGIRRLLVKAVERQKAMLRETG